MRTSMAINKKELTRAWIDFLKRNQIAELKSDPETGNLKYKKEVTPDDLARFLRNTAEFEEDAIKKAIRTVVSRKAPGQKQPDQLPPPEQQKRPEQPQIGSNTPSVPQIGSNTPSAPPAKKSKYNKDDATDVDYRDINEAIKDIVNISLSEDDVEAVFGILTAPAPAAPNAAPEVDQEAEQAKKIENVNRIKRMIRDTMTDAQRKALWRILTDA